MMSNLNHVAIAKGYLFFYLLFFYKAELAAADPLPIRVQSDSTGASNSKHRRGYIRDGEYMPVNGLRLTRSF
jgi:hypothetical protein